MKLDTLRDLEKAIKLCRKLGVDSIKIGDVEFHLGSKPQVSRITSVKKTSVTTDSYVDPSIITEDTKILSDELTDEQKLYWSTGTEEQHEAM